MARNGVDFGIRLSGTGERWFTAEAPLVDGLFFPGYSTDDAARDLGDSTITETAGVGGFAMAAAPDERWDLPEVAGVGGGIRLRHWRRADDG